MTPPNFQEPLAKYLTDAHSIEEPARVQMRSAPKLAGFVYAFDHLERGGAAVLSRSSCSVCLIERGKPEERKEST